VILPSYPGSVESGGVISFFPHVGEGPALEGVLSPCIDHSFFGDWHVTVFGEFLAILLFSDVHNEG
jgi:hypothetical protein